MFDLALFNLIVLSVGLAVFFYARQSGALDWKRAGKLHKLMLYFLVAISVAGYLRFGDMDRRDQGLPVLFDYHDIFHYYIGPKYYAEIGHTLLYECTLVAFDELRQDSIAVPDVARARSLTDSWSAVTKDTLDHSHCLERFSSRRWKSFKDDLQVFLAYGWNNDDWRSILIDHGNNQPPSWNVVVGTLVNLIPFNPLILNLLPLFDLVLLLVVAPLALRSLGWYTAVMFLVVLCNNVLSTYGWVGGSLFRSAWFVLLSLGVVALADKRNLSAGLCFGIATAFKLFPLFFAAGAVIPMVHGRNWPWLWRFLAGFAASIVVLFFASTLMYGADRWWEFYEIILRHSKIPALNHIGFYNFEVYSSALNEIPHFSGVKVIMPNIISYFELSYQNNIVINTSIIVMAVAAAVWICLRMPPHFSALIFGAVTLYFCALGAGYYYVYLALLIPFLFLDKSGRFGTYRVALACGMLLLLTLQDLAFTSLVLECQMVNSIFYYFFLLLVLLFFIDTPTISRRLRLPES